MNVATSACYHEGMPVAVTNADKMNEMAQSVWEKTDSQRGSYRALKHNLAAAQRRGIRLTRDGMGKIRAYAQGKALPS